MQSNASPTQHEPTRREASPSNGEKLSILDRASAVTGRATRDILSALGRPQPAAQSEMPDTPDALRLSQGFSSKTSSSLTIGDRQFDAMSRMLRDQGLKIARNRMAQRRAGHLVDDEDDLPRLHKTQRLRAVGDSLIVDLGTRGTSGANIVALPEMSRRGDGSVHCGKGVTVVEIALGKEGAQTIDVRDLGLVKNGRGLSVLLSFTEERENFRSTQGHTLS